MAFIKPDTYTRFESEDVAVTKLKEWKLLPPTAKSSKTFLYKGIYVKTPTECTVIGYGAGLTAVIEFADGGMHTIHPSYLKEMQKKDFSLTGNNEEDEE